MLVVEPSPLEFKGCTYADPWCMALHPLNLFVAPHLILTTSCNDRSRCGSRVMTDCHVYTFEQKPRFTVRVSEKEYCVIPQSEWNYPFILVLSSVVSSTRVQMNFFKAAFLSMLTYIISQLSPFSSSTVFALMGPPLLQERHPQNHRFRFPVILVPTNIFRPEVLQSVKRTVPSLKYGTVLHLHSDACEGPCLQHYTRCCLSTKDFASPIVLAEQHAAPVIQSS